MRDQLQNNYPGEIFAEKRKPRKFYLLLVDIKDVQPSFTKYVNYFSYLVGIRFVWYFFKTKQFLPNFTTHCIWNSLIHPSSQLQKNKDTYMYSNYQQEGGVRDKKVFQPKKYPSGKIYQKVARMYMYQAHGTLSSIRSSNSWTHANHTCTHKHKQPTTNRSVHKY